MKNTRRQFIANHLQLEVFLIVFTAALVPTVSMTLIIYFLFTGIEYQGIGDGGGMLLFVRPEIHQFINAVLLATPVLIIALLVFALKLTHSLVGPYERIIRELDGCLSGKGKKRIHLRDGDKFDSLVDRINRLLDRIP